MTRTRSTRGALTGVGLALLLTGTACSSDDGGSTASTSSSSATATASTAPDTTAVGVGCAQLPADPAAPGSLAAMAAQPVAAAAATNQLLTTLTSVLGQANLTDALNAQTDVTVLAPANAAFDAVPADQLNALLADLPRLTTVLQHHVISGRLAPDQLVGDHTTLLGDTVTVGGTADALTLSADQTVLGAADATVLCGNVQTANATVYIIDQVLSPEA